MEAPEAQAPRLDGARWGHANYAYQVEPMGEEEEKDYFVPNGYQGAMDMIEAPDGYLIEEVQAGKEEIFPEEGVGRLPDSTFSYQGFGVTQDNGEMVDMPDGVEKTELNANTTSNEAGATVRLQPVIGADDFFSSDTAAHDAGHVPRTKHGQPVFVLTGPLAQALSSDGSKDSVFATLSAVNRALATPQRSFQNLRHPAVSDLLNHYFAAIAGAPAAIFAAIQGNLTNNDSFEVINQAILAQLGAIVGAVGVAAYAAASTAAESVTVQTAVAASAHNNDDALAIAADVVNAIGADFAAGGDPVHAENEARTVLAAANAIYNAMNAALGGAGAAPDAAAVEGILNGALAGVAVQRALAGVTDARIQTVIAAAGAEPTAGAARAVMAAAIADGRAALGDAGYNRIVKDDCLASFIANGRGVITDDQRRDSSIVARFASAYRGSMPAALMDNITFYGMVDEDATTDNHSGRASFYNYRGRIMGIVVEGIHVSVKADFGATRANTQLGFEMMFARGSSLAALGGAVDAAGGVFPVLVPTTLNCNSMADVSFIPAGLANRNSGGVAGQETEEEKKLDKQSLAMVDKIIAKKEGLYSDDGMVYAAGMDMTVWPH